MKTRRDFIAQTAAWSALACSPLRAQERNPVAPHKPSRSVVGSNVAATVHPMASKAAVSMMAKGGNAIDAAIAAAVCLSVVDGHNSGIGGGCLILLRTQDGSVHAIDGRDRAPAEATEDMFTRAGIADVNLSQNGPLACGVPGMVAALKSAHDRFGKLTWSALFEPAIQAAFDGFEVTRSVHNTLRQEQKNIAKFAPAAKALLKPDATPYEIGELLVQRDLASTLELIANKGSDWFYQGEFADQCAKYIRQQGGILSVKDFESYRAVNRDPLRTQYRGYQVVGFPTPSSSGIHIQQMLQMLTHFPLKELYGQGDAVDYYHVLAEAMKLAFADRAFYLGDNDFVDVPSFLTSQAYTDELAKRIDLNQSSVVSGHYEAKGKAIDDAKKHTTHLTTADHQGNWVALTATVNTSWGNKMVVPGTGVVLNNQMDDFSISPGVPNAFGLIGSKANAIAPGKRPLSSMSPTIILDSQGNPSITCGAAGGPRIINATLQTLLRCMDLDASIGTAIDASRIHHQWQPDSLFCEASLGGPFARDVTKPNQLIDQLKAKGHKAQLYGTIAVVQGIQRAPAAKNENQWIAACDPRAEGLAASS